MEERFMLSKPTTFKFNAEQVSTLDDLKNTLNASSRSEVVRKALALLKVASENSHDNAVTIIGKDGRERDIILS